MHKLDDELRKSHELYMKRRRERANNDEETKEEQQPKPKKQARKTKKEKTLDFLYSLPSSSSPEDKYQFENASSMVRNACINLKNINDLDLMEWSEAVMLQLCSLKTELDWALIDWINTRSILEFQWTYEVVESLHEHTGTTDTLKDILTKNHENKIKKQYIKSHQMFHKTPKINYSLLKTFHINPELAKRLDIPTINIKRRTQQTKTSQESS